MAHKAAPGHYYFGGTVFKREPTLVIGTIVTALVTVYAYWRGLDAGEVLVQLAALVASFVAIRAKVTPYVEGGISEVNRLRGGYSDGGIVK
jgi:hypothetical protein